LKYNSLEDLEMILMFPNGATFFFVRTKRMEWNGTTTCIWLKKYPLPTSSPGMDGAKWEFRTEGSPNGTFIAVSIPINYGDSSTFLMMWHGS
jgi:hypothetical protein